jgi:exopolyphosphatase/guanosine-5'-triphosphate,3'-diphosphate pyrophosphatase
MPYSNHHSDSNPSVAVIDIGSNSSRMVVYDTNYTPPHITFNEKLFCALGRDLGSTGKLNPEGAVAALKSLKAYSLIADVQKLPHVLVVGTAALRDAADSDEFIAQVKQEAGLTIRVISGDEEATYAARGVLMLDPDAEGVVADFGGGSLELARIANTKVMDTVSLPLGAYRVEAMGNAAQGKMTTMLMAQRPEFRGGRLYGIGGSWRSMCKIYAEYSGQTGAIIPSSAMNIFCEYIEKQIPTDLQKQFRIEAPRARLAPIAAFVLRTLIQTMGYHEITSSTAGVRDGLIHEFLSTSAEKR